MAQIMEKHNLSLTFVHDDKNDTKLMEIWVPENIDTSAILSTLKEDHDYLCSEEAENNGDDIYARTGYTPESLLAYTCKKHGWRWDEIEFDGTLELL